MSLFENFPYTDLHNLNLDWIIKIAKDFLDQYTHLQELIENGENSLNGIISDGTESLNDLIASGIEDLNNKKDELENALESWYTQHSNDISGQLASAILEIINTKDIAVYDFTTTAQGIAETVTESIPADYSALAAQVAYVYDSLLQIWEDSAISTIVSPSDFTLHGLLDGSTGAFTADSVIDHLCTDFIPIYPDTIYIAECSVPIRYALIYDSNKSYTQRAIQGNQNKKFKTASNAAYIRFNINYTDFTLSCEAPNPISIVDYADFTLHGLLDSTGTFTADSVTDHLCTDYIEIRPDTNYTCQASVIIRYAILYDKYKRYISRAVTGQASNTFVTPSDAAYIRFNVNYTDFTITCPQQNGYQGLNQNLFDFTLTQNYKIPNSKTVGDRIKPLEDEMQSIASFKTPVLINNDSFNLHGLLSSTGEFTPDAVSDHKCTGFIEAKPNVYYKVNFNNGSVPRQGCVYDENQNFTRQILIGSSYLWFVLSDNEKYVRININTPDPFTFECYEIAKGTEEYAVLNSNTEIPGINKIGKTLIRERKGLISFTIDGDYDLNSSFVNLFNKYNKKIGFAIGYNEFGLNNSIEQYLTWCNAGHEMLCYGVVPLPESASYTYGEAKAFIKTAYNAMTARGFNVNGFVGANGAVATRYLPIVKEMFSYAGTKNNNYGNEESCLFFADNDPCEIFRYSCQLSTIAQMKAAVDRCKSEKGLLPFYFHAESANLQNATIANIEELIQYIINEDVEIVTPYEAFTDYYTVRRSDII